MTLAVQNGIVMAFAVVYLPLIHELGASRGQGALVQALVLLVGGLAAPVVGHAFDRLGPRRLLPGGAVVAAIGLLAASRSGSLASVLLGYGFVGGLGLATLGSQTNLVLAALWYPKARGRAIAVADLGTGLGAFAFIPLAQALVTISGWRTVLLAWSAVLLVVIVPINRFQGLPRRGHSARGPGGPGASWSLRAALRAPAFWWLAAMRFWAACAFPLVNTHAVAYAVGQGITQTGAAAALGSVSLVSLLGRMITGVLADRIGRAQTLTVTYTSAALGIACFALLALAGSSVWVWAFVLLFGLSQGSSGIVASARAADIFAGPAFGVIYGWLALAVGPGEAIGAWAGGAIYDWTGSYLPAFGFVVLALGMALAALWRVHPGPAPSR